MSCLKRLWSDEAGFIISSELVLVATIVVLGMVVGLCILRNQVVQELADVGLAIGSVSQSFAFSGISTGSKHIAWTDGSGYHDLIDFCQSTQPKGSAPAGITVNAIPEEDWDGNDLGDEPPGGETSK